MLYHLLYPFSKVFSGFNVFRYLTFRGAGAVITALLVSFLLGPAIIRRLRALKVGQQVRDDGPQSHLTKQGTPTMGGLLIIASIVLSHLFAHPMYCRKKAAEYGAYTERFVETILASHALVHLRKAQAVLRLGVKYGARRLEEACEYLLHLETTQIHRLQRILEKGVPTLFRPAAEPKKATVSQQALSFLHSPESFAARGEEVS